MSKLAVVHFIENYRDYKDLCLSMSTQILLRKTGDDAMDLNTAFPQVILFGVSLFLFNTGSYYVAQTDLEITM